MICIKSYLKNQLIKLKLLILIFNYIHDLIYYFLPLLQKRKRKKQRREDEEGKEMKQIKIGNEDKTEGINEKMLLTSENVDITMLNEVEETLKNSSKVV